MGGARVLFVLALRGGHVRTLSAEVDAEVRPDALDGIVQRLNERLAGHTLDEIRRTGRDRVQDLADDDRTGIVRVVLRDAPDLFRQPAVEAGRHRRRPAPGGPARVRPARVGPRRGRAGRERGRRDPPSRAAPAARRRPRPGARPDRPRGRARAARRARPTPSSRRRTGPAGASAPWPCSARPGWTTPGPSAWSSTWPGSWATPPTTDAPGLEDVPHPGAPRSPPSTPGRPRRWPADLEADRPASGRAVSPPDSFDPGPFWAHLPTDDPSSFHDRSPCGPLRRPLRHATTRRRTRRSRSPRPQPDGRGRWAPTRPSPPTTSTRSACRTGCSA